MFQAALNTQVEHQAIHMKTTEPIIERATLADAEQLVALEQGLFMTDNCSRKNFRYLIQRATVIVVRTEKSGKIIGYAILLSRKNSRKGRIYSLGVDASARNTGIGSKLIANLEAIAGQANFTMLTLEVSDTNKAAIVLYNKWGFKQYGFRYNYYQDGGHALLMRKNLTVLGFVEEKDRFEPPDRA
jgi:ribosomal protein S18 acetylase RimI-like enzyme